MHQSANEVVCIVERKVNIPDGFEKPVYRWTRSQQLFPQHGSETPGSAWENPERTFVHCPNIYYSEKIIVLDVNGLSKIGMLIPE